MSNSSGPSASNKTYSIDYQQALNAAQLEAVTYSRGPLLVIAGAGSGKTRTLTYRVARLVEDGIAASAILLLTFTRKASQEMLQRAAKLLDRRCEMVSGGTFHSFANATLRKYAGVLGMNSGFTILDRADAESMINLLRKELDPGIRQRSFPRKGALANIFSKAVNKVLSIDEVVYEDYPHFLTNLESIEHLHKAYEERKQEHQFLDFDDLLVNLLFLLKNHPDIRERVASRYEYIMVDEYQDTNTIQAEILYLLAGAHENIMVVGDDSQSIYAFRGANFKNIMNFPKMFPGTRIISLEENYRSVQPILQLTNEIIDRAKEKYSKQLFTRRPGGEIPVLLAVEDENMQSRFVIDKINELSHQQIPLCQIAVLFRASFHSFDLEIELNREGIPFIKVGGFKFVESAHIKDVLAHLRVMANVTDRISWYRILLLIDKIGPKSAQKIYEAVLKQKSDYTGLLSMKLKTASAQGVERLKNLFSKTDTHEMSVVQLGEAILKYYMPILEQNYDDHPKRARDLEHLVAIMERYESLEHFLTDMALEPPNASIDDSMASESRDEDRLVLSTVHSAKGLEWDTVFVIWALDGRFPSIHSFFKEAELEEELRLMYVAATRAKTNLFFTFPTQAYDRGTGTVLSRPSRFLDFIPEHILEKRYIEY
ncbi:MAG: ATP-dependent helicase [Deltaproteobacteria bacterium]|jgi:DNA helicase-2/ATP-dependent DNA helicase PcrA|nr:ATP-dependent helicase [Deltaproteobacteria bacterium]